MDKDTINYIGIVVVICFLAVCIGVAIYYAGADKVARSECISAGYDSGQYIKGEIVCTVQSVLGG